MLCKEEKLLLMADEVYQENVWNSKRPFISFKKVLRDLGDKAAGVEMISFHSVSKGFVGEYVCHAMVSCVGAEKNMPSTVIFSGFLRSFSFSSLSFTPPAPCAGARCGRRGGYMELINIDPDVKMQLYKMASISLCSNVEGQIMVPTHLFMVHSADSTLHTLVFTPLSLSCGTCTLSRWVL